uniref:Uncharacterized protein n=1 Tax=viral metagenome TaxID=1070528 RepID=A0A6M3LL04_9ZZZZ
MTWIMEYKTSAPKLIDLHNRIIDAIAIAGDDADWLGWHDGELRIFSKNEDIILEISPYQDECPDQEKKGPQEE